MWSVKKENSQILVNSLVTSVAWCTDSNAKTLGLKQTVAHSKTAIYIQLHTPAHSKIRTGSDEHSKKKKSAYLLGRRRLNQRLSRTNKEMKA